MRFLSFSSLALTGLLAVSTSFSPSVYAANLYGTNNSETIYGTSAADTIVAYAGNDTVYGGDGNDVIYGNAGADSLIGDQGSDTFYGGADSDKIYMYGGDTARGENGIDAIYVQTGAYDVCPYQGPAHPQYGATVECDYTILANNGFGVYDPVYTPFGQITGPGSRTYFVPPANGLPAKYLNVNVY